MYITTFYSFKGGVGRTLALVNVAVDLCQSGRRVLLVDFDLEAPGIDTFEALKPSAPHPGVVEFVTDFKATLAAPDVRQYVYETHGVARDNGRLWVMPAGMGDGSYQTKLARIDWRDLYRNFDGYLLFEDLKAQWQKAFAPDYVFIDSRTGHTDVEGICTRQLPDAVVGLFFPNEQNLAGLRQVVSAVRAEAKEPRARKIQLHFVMSNVPDLDDEEEILNKRMEDFQEKLGYDSLTATVHRYESLSLLNQVIFTRERPKSRLSKEYRQIRDAIVAENIEDREGAVRFLKDSYQPWEFQFGSGDKEFQNRVSNIVKAHPKDGELLFLVATIRKSERRFKEALSLLDEAIRQGYSTPECLLERATIRKELEDGLGAITDIKESLSAPGLAVPLIEKAIRIVSELDESVLPMIFQSPAVKSLQSLEDRAEVYVEAVLPLIAHSLFSEAVRLADEMFTDLRSLPVEGAFNYAMAKWGETGQPSRESFERVLACKGREERSGANFAQCLAITYWAVASFEEAGRHLEKAEILVREDGEGDFSCWRYSSATPKEFLEDCASIRKLIAGEKIQPLFFPQGHVTADPKTL